MSDGPAHPPLEPYGAPVAPPPPPPDATPGPAPVGKVPFRWQGYPGVSLLGAGRSLGATLGIPLVALLTLVLAGFVIGLWGGLGKLAPNTRALAQLGIFGGAYGVWFLLAAIGRRHPGVSFAERVGLRPFSVGPGLAAAFVAMSLGLYFEIAFSVVVSATGVKVPVQPSVTQIFPVTPLGIAVGLFIGCVLGPLAEEIVFRGVLFAGLRDRIGEGWAALVSGAAFSAAHLNWFLFVPFMVLGMLFARITSQTRSVWPAVFAHSLFNLVAFVFAYGAYYLSKASVAWLPGALGVLVR